MRSAGSVSHGGTQSEFVSPGADFGADLGAATALSRPCLAFRAHGRDVAGFDAPSLLELETGETELSGKYGGQAIEECFLLLVYGGVVPSIPCRIPPKVYGTNTAIVRIHRHHVRRAVARMRSVEAGAPLEGPIERGWRFRVRARAFP